MAKSKKLIKGPPRCLLIAGPNGAGKTTFAREYLSHDVRVLNFVNADLIATGLSPLKPELAAIAAARLVLEEIDRLTARRADFAWESNLRGVTYAKRMRAMKQLGKYVPPAGRCLGRIRQFESTADAGRIRTMKRKTGTQNSNRNPELAARVGRALVRAGESARRTARMYGTPLYVWERGRVVAKRP